ncbi:hypothetical protein BK126_10175 [Paenibacillus sp. FSL H7-0326]|nr:hypothetical protein BK126_10175 [Paenibacillus sp. FSL H7-0326]
MCMKCNGNVKKFIVDISEFVHFFLFMLFRGKQLKKCIGSNQMFIVVLLPLRVPFKRFIIIQL